MSSFEVVSIAGHPLKCKVYTVVIVNTLYSCTARQKALKYANYIYDHDLIGIYFLKYESFEYFKTRFVCEKVDISEYSKIVKELYFQYY